MCPAVASLIAELIPKYLDPDVVRVVNGGVPETSKVCHSTSHLYFRLTFCFSSLNTPGDTVGCLTKRFYMPLTFPSVCYTGSQRVAKIIGVAAAKTLSPVTFEVRLEPLYLCRIFLTNFPFA